MKGPFRAWLRKILICATVATSFSLIGVEIYAQRVRAKAQALMDTALRIRSTQDAKREIEGWRSHGGAAFWDESDQLGDQHCYDAQIHNLTAARSLIVEPTVLNVTIALRDGELYYVLLTMESGRASRPTAAVWVQEWFDGDARPVVHVSAKGKPWSVAIDFTSSVPEGQRRKAFGLRSSCFTKPLGCRSAEELLPNVWSLSADNR